MPFLSPNKVSLKNTSNNNKNYKREIIELLVQNTSFSTLLLSHLAALCFIPTEPSSTINSLNSWDLNIELEVTVRLYLPTFTILNSGRWAVTISSIKKIFSSLKTVKMSMDSSQWTVQATVLCLTWFKDHIVICRLEWLTSEFCIETNLLELYQVWPESEDSNKMMLISSAEQIKSKHKF